MLNLFQHLINSMNYETLNQVQGDKKAIATQSLEGEGRGGVTEINTFVLIESPSSKFENITCLKGCNKEGS